MESKDWNPVILLIFVVILILLGIGEVFGFLEWDGFMEEENLATMEPPMRRDDQLIDPFAGAKRGNW